jgi:hypothetical protein
VLALAPAFALVTSVFTAYPAQDVLAILYAVDGESRVLEGCFPPCRCPLQILQGLAGTFDLVARETDESGFDVFEVEDLELSVLAPDVSAVRVSGSGVYRRRPADPAGEPAVHELVLDVSVDDGPLERLQSGVVSASSALPRIAIAVSRNGMVCDDLVLEILAAPAGPPDVRFARGDCNDDSRHDLSDAVAALAALFLGGGEISCAAACDANSDLEVDIADPIYLLGFLFLAGGAPPPPFPDCESVPAAGAAGCERFTSCA